MRRWGWLSIGLVALTFVLPTNCQDLLQMFNEGIRLYQEGKTDEALALFRKVVEINPNDGEAWVYIGTILLSKNDHESAISVLEKGLSQSLPGLIAAQGWVNLGVAYQLGRRDMVKAIEAYERAIAFKPDLPEAHHNLILARLLQNNFAEALKACERAFSILGKPLKPEQIQATFEKALEFLVRDYEKALELLRSMAQQQLPRHEFFSLTGQAYEGLKQFSRAALFYGQAAALAPQVGRYHVSFGLALRQIKRLPEAVKVLERAIALNDRDAFAMTVLGITYSDLGRWQEAVITLRRAVELDPQNFDAHSALAMAYAHLGQIPQAMQGHLVALGIREEPNILNNLARLYLLQGENAEQRGQIKEADDAYQQAVQRLRRALQLNANFAPARLNLAIALRRRARVLLQQGQTKLAEETFQEAEKVLQEHLAQNPDPIVKLEMARLLGDKRRYDEALKLVREVIAAQPKLEDAYIFLGFIALQLARLDDAEQAYMQALKLNPKSADAMVGLGVVAFHKNRLDEAEAWFSRALKINPNHSLVKQNLEIVRQAREKER